MTTPSNAEIFSSMHAVMCRVGAIGKDGTNQQQKFKFRGIDQVYNSLHRLMAEEAVFTTSEILSASRDERTNKNGTVLSFVTLTVKYVFHSGKDGSCVASTVCGEGMDAGDKATAKAMAIAHKYCLLQAFMVPTEDMIDPDAESHEVSIKTITMEQAQKITEKLEQAKMGIGEFNHSAGISQLTHLAADRYEGSLAFIDNRIKILKEKSDAE